MALKPDNLNEKKELVDQIDVMKAKEAGSKILVKGPTGKWSDVENPSFNWGVTDYGVKLDYTDFLNQAAMSLDYVSLSNKLNWMERGEKLENIVDYSVKVLKDSKSKVISEVKSQLPGIYSKTTFVNEDTLINNEAFTLVKQAIKHDFMEQAKNDIERDPSIINTYGDIDHYYDLNYSAQEKSKTTQVISDLDSVIKELSSEKVVLSTSSLVSNTIDSAIFEQELTKEKDTYSGKAPNADQLKERVSSNIIKAIDKYNNCKDGDYICQNDNELSITLKKQLGEEAPAICIKYGLETYSFNGVGCPQIDWDFNREGNVVTITGVTQDYVDKLINSLSGILNARVDEATHKQDNQIIEIQNYVRDSLDNIKSSVDVSLENKLRDMETMYRNMEERLNNFFLDDHILKMALEKEHPVGSIYMSLDPTDPAELFGGSWVRIEDAFIFARGDSNTFEVGTPALFNRKAKLGGHSDGMVTLTVDEMPKHSHNGSCSSSSTGNPLPALAMAGFGATACGSGSHSHTIYIDETGGSKPFSIMPPYVSAYCWYRIDENLLENPIIPNVDLPNSEFTIKIESIPYTYTGETGYAHYFICNSIGTLRLTVFDDRSNNNKDSYFAFWHNKSKIWSDDIDNREYTRDISVSLGDVIVIETSDYSNRGSLNYNGSGYKGGLCRISLNYV